MSTSRTLSSLLITGGLFIASHAHAQTALGVPLDGQNTGSWCYAASTQMIGAYFGSTIAQCTIANWDNGRTDCCTSPTPSACVNGGDTNATLAYWGFPSTKAGGSISYGSIQSEINAGRPVQTSINWNNSSVNHSIVVDGYWTKSDGTQHVHILNPLPVNAGDEEWATYTVYLNGGTEDSGGNLGGHSIISTSYGLHWGPSCSYDFDDLPSSAYQQCWDQRVHHNQWPQSLSSGDDKMAGNWHGSGNRPVSWNVSLSDLTSRANSISGSWRPDQITVNSNNPAQYNCIWTQETTHAWTTHYALDASTFIADDNTLWQQGYVMHDIYGYNANGTPQFSGTWVKEPGTYYLDVGVSISTFQADDTNHRLAGYMLTRFSTYTDANGVWRVAALWLPSTVSAYHYFYNQSPSSYQSNYNTYTAAGYKLAYTSMFGSGNINAIYTK